MQFRARVFVRAVLPAAALFLCVGYGSGTTGTDVARSSLPVANQAPVIAGNTEEIARVGQDYLFQPNVTDSDGDKLQFSVSNLPPWASFDASTGKISGRPTTTHVGSYESISILVSDGRHQISSREFTITVLGPSNGVARLEWPMPVSKVDGSMLDDLAGFRIIYGRDAESLDHSVWIADPKAHSYEFATLAEGPWYFSIVAVNANGLEGPATSPARKII